MPKEIKLTGVQLPGRETKIKEPPFTRLQPIVRTLANIMEGDQEAPFAFFGHSMGALISFELARELRRRDQAGPNYLLVSAYRAPHLPDTHAPIHSLSNKEFMKAIQSIGGTPEAVLTNQELMDLFLPVLRSDFSLCETYQYQAEPKLPCPILALGGTEDKAIQRFMLEAWAEQTTRPFKLIMFPGNHFYLEEQREAVLKTLLQELKKLY